VIAPARHRRASRQQTAAPQRLLPSRQLPTPRRAPQTAIPPENPGGRHIHASTERSGLGLISAPGSLLLFEQPELHLHPDVQAALGDFFLALSRSGRQLIVETHSEYLVNRLRRRAAEGQPDVTDLARLFFFQRRDGRSEVTPGVIGANGSMPKWPRGFFDTAAREIEAIAFAGREPHSEPC
jgi:hypothetical protein